VKEHFLQRAEEIRQDMTGKDPWRQATMDLAFLLLIDIIEDVRLLREEVKNIMSAISDFADKVDANFAKIQSGITALDAEIQAFQNSPGTLSPDDQARLDSIVAKSSALADAANAPVTPPAAS
jgi:hypothetical protein